MPFASAASRQSLRSVLPIRVACGAPAKGPRLASTMSPLSCRAPPSAQPAQLTSDRTASSTTGRGSASKREVATWRARRSVDTSTRFPRQPAPFLLLGGERLRRTADRFHPAFAEQPLAHRRGPDRAADFLVQELDDLARRRRGRVDAEPA